MHRSLQIPEVVGLVFDAIASSRDEDYRMWTTETSATLAALATTCKGFSDPALDLLWMYQDSLSPLLRCFPVDIWDEDDDETLSRPIVPSDWERPLRYSRRVRSFQYDDRDFSPHSPELLETLGFCFPAAGEHLFPNIEYLEWFASDPSMFAHFRLLLGPRLTSLTLGLCASPVHLSLLPSLPIQCPLLTEVDITFSDDMEQSDGFQSLMFLVQGLRRLTALTVPCLDDAAMDRLARLPVVQSLTLTNQSTMTITPSAFSDFHFPCLRTLVATSTVEALCAIIPLIKYAPIDDLIAIFPKSTSSHMIAHLYAALATATMSDGPPSCLRLNCVRSLEETLIGPPSVTFAIHSTQLRSLFHFQFLTFVELSAPAGFDLDDATVADMALAWPHLQTLELRASNYAHVKPRVTLGGLLPLAQYCLKLRSLQMTFDASMVPEWETLKTSAKKKKRVRQEYFQTLHVAQSPVEKPFAVAAFLSSVFPKLNSITTDLDRNPAQNTNALRTNWKAVELALAVLRNVRAEEKYWTGRGRN
ncbi:hypothetical protein C8R45DRAFT_1216121 [Mycena sanguinolenta]|nr:hypothetical protein C8R45DRAFT_1216121 [Mycena sanguinolenta]